MAKTKKASRAKAVITAHRHLVRRSARDKVAQEREIQRATTSAAIDDMAASKARAEQAEAALAAMTAERDRQQDHGARLAGEASAAESALASLRTLVDRIRECARLDEKEAEDRLAANNVQRANLSYHTAKARARTFRLCAEQFAALLAVDAPSEVAAVDTQQCSYRNEYGQRCIHREGHDVKEQPHACYGYQDPAYAKPRALVPLPEAAASPPCSLCGGPHRFDTTVPSVVWNEAIRAAGLPEYLCATCIIEQFAKRNESFNCELWGGAFNGLPVAVHFNSRRARGSVRVVEENNDLRVRLSEAERACKNFKKERADRDAPRVSDETRLARTGTEAPSRLCIVRAGIRPTSRSSRWGRDEGEIMTAVEMIAEKARTNREHKGYTEAHDDEHDYSELIQAAMCYLDAAEPIHDLGNVSPPWPFEPESWRPSDDPIRNLVHAGALIVAEIERRQRYARKK
jgi:hypothetical protein